MNKVDIVEVISSYLPIEKSGQNYKCLCPFHADTNPSMIISPEKQIYKCFVCGAGGDYYNFIKRYENINDEQVKMILNDKFGIHYQKVKIPIENKILEDIKEFYHVILNDSKMGEVGKKYLLEDRKFTQETINYFKLGYAPTDESLQKYLKLQIDNKKEYSQLDVDGLEVFQKNEKDFFNGRVIIPICNIKGQTVGFSGRTLDKDNKIKYLNSRTNKIFKKNELLFNLNNLNANDDYLLIVEGHLDVIMAWQNGINNVVGTMGTAFTQEHLKLIKNKGIKNIFLGLDNDNAGKEASHKIAQLFIKEKILPNIINYGQYKDIDEFFKKSHLTWLDLKKTSVNYLEYLITNTNIDDVNEKAKIVNYIKELNIDNQDIKNQILLQNIADKLNINVDFLNTSNVNEYNQKEVKVESYKKQNKITSSLLPDNRELILIYLITISKKNFLELEESIKNNEFLFIEYYDTYLKIKQYYQKENNDNKNHNILIMMDEIEELEMIEKEIQKYEIFQQNIDIPINNFINKINIKKQINLMK